jgi:hypothetical protein
MKILKLLTLFILITGTFGCSKKNKNQDKNKRWEVNVSGIGVNIEITDISKDFYNLQIPISEFRKKYPFYLDADYPDAEYEKQRRDTTELNIY